MHMQKKYLSLNTDRDQVLSGHYLGFELCQGQTFVCKPVLDRVVCTEKYFRFNLGSCLFLESCLKKTSVSSSDQARAAHPE